MPTRLSAVQILTSHEELRTKGSPDRAGVALAMTPLAARVHGEFREMPGLRLTVPQVARLFSLVSDVAETVLHELRRASILTRSDDGLFSLNR